MPFRYPREVAQRITNRWESSIIGSSCERPTLPPVDLLTRLLEVAFFASLEIEERRLMKFRLYCIPEGGNLKRHNHPGLVESLRLSTPIQLTIIEIRRLTPAICSATSGLIVEWSENRSDLQIVGIAHVGNSWERAVRGAQYRHLPPPAALNVLAEGPGRLTISQGAFTICKFDKGDFVSFPISSAFQMGGVQPVLEAGLETLRPRIMAPKREPLHTWNEFEWLAFLNVFFQIASSIERLGHGGTLIVCAPDWGQNASVNMKIKYPLNRSPIIQDLFIRFINARNKHSDAIEGIESDDLTLEEQHGLVLLETIIGESMQELSAQTEQIATFAGVDGAVLLGSNLICHGFGCEIDLSSAPSVDIYSVHGLAHRKHERLSETKYGMRHRAAFRLCGTSDSLFCFICSQDGGVTMAWREATILGEELSSPDVLVIPGLSTANANLALI